MAQFQIAKTLARSTNSAHQRIDCKHRLLGGVHQGEDKSGRETGDGETSDRLKPSSFRFSKEKASTTGTGDGPGGRARRPPRHPARPGRGERGHQLHGIRAVTFPTSEREPDQREKAGLGQNAGPIGPHDLIACGQRTPAGDRPAAATCSSWWATDGVPGMARMAAEQPPERHFANPWLRRVRQTRAHLGGSFPNSAPDPRRSNRLVPPWPTVLFDRYRVRGENQPRRRTPFARTASAGGTSTRRNRDG